MTTPALSPNEARRLNARHNALYDELTAALCAPITARAKQRLTDLGIRCPLITAAPILASPPHYTPDPEGTPHILFPVLAGHHVCGDHITPRDTAGRSVALVDIAAWRSDNPAVVLLRRGNVAALGEHNLPPFGPDDTLRLYATPASWAAADFDGAVVMDWDTVTPLLLEWPQIVCETVSLGQTVKQQLRHHQRRLTPRLPGIFIPKAA